MSDSSAATTPVSRDLPPTSLAAVQLSQELERLAHQAGIERWDLGAA